MLRVCSSVASVSRTHTLSAPSLCTFAPTVDALEGWTLAEQDAWIAAPHGDAMFHDCIGIADATYIRVQRPKTYALERRMYSTYKKYHAMFFVVIIDRRGECESKCAARACVCSSLTPSICSLMCAALLITPAGRFRCVDLGNTPVGSSEAIAFCKLCPWLRPTLRILGDVAYTSDSRCRVPYKSPQLRVANAGSAAEARRRQRYNQRLSSSRQRVEHAFSRLKHTFRLLQTTWNMPLSQLPRTFRAACLLCNWLARTRNLYTYDD